MNAVRYQAISIPLADAFSQVVPWGVYSVKRGPRNHTNAGHGLITPNRAPSASLLEFQCCRLPSPSCKRPSSRVIRADTGASWDARASQPRPAARARMMA
jgi:hypothetical protein